MKIAGSSASTSHGGRVEADLLVRLAQRGRDARRRRSDRPRRRGRPPGRHACAWSAARCDAAARTASPPVRRSERISTADCRPLPSSGGSEPRQLSGPDGRGPPRPAAAASPGRGSVTRSVRVDLGGASSPASRRPRVGRPVAVRTGTAWRSGRRRRPACVSGRSAGRARSPGATGSSTPSSGSASATSASTLTGSVSSVHRQRRDSRPKCVSTVMPGMPKALPSTTFAVLRPKPGSVTSSARVCGTSPSNRSTSAWPSLISDVGLVPEEAGRLDQLLELGAVRAGVVGRVRVLGEQRRGHLVDPLVGALRGQDGGHRQLERRA